MSTLKGYRAYRLMACRPFVFIGGDPEDGDLARVALTMGFSPDLLQYYEDSSWVKEPIVAIMQMAVRHFEQHGLPMPVEVLVNQASAKDPREVLAMASIAGEIASTPLPAKPELSHAVASLITARVMSGATAEFEASRSRFMEEGGDADALLDGLLDNLRGLQRIAYKSRDRDVEPFVAIRERIAGHVGEEPPYLGRTAYLGLDKFDRVTGGILPGEMCIIMGKTNVGKSYLGQHICKHTAECGNVAVLASVEMSVDRNLDRFAGMWLSRDNAMLRQQGLSSAFRDFLRLRLEKTVAEVPGEVVVIDPRFCDTTPKIREAMRDICRQYRPSVLVVDYLSQIRPTNRYASALDYQMVGEVSRELIQIAHEFEVGLVTLAQTSAEGDKHGADAYNLGLSKEPSRDAAFMIELRHANKRFDDIEDEDGLPPVRELRGTVVKSRNTIKMFQCLYELDFRTGVLKNLVSEFPQVNALRSEEGMEAV